MEQPSLGDWLIFSCILFPLLGIDLWFQRGGRGSGKRSAVLWSVVWVCVGVFFSFYIYARWGEHAAQSYLAAYLIEKSLSLDNLFVFLLIFRAMRIPQHYQRTALAWGIFGALVTRGIFIGLGIAALERWGWVEYVFAALLFYAAIEALRETQEPQAESAVVNWLAHHLPVCRDCGTARFFAREGGRLKLTPLFVTILALESTDILFAVDSVPAALAVSRHDFIVYSSNAFAILGLRALYVLLAVFISGMHYLRYGLAGVLIFAALKMITPERYQLSPLVSVLVIVAIIGAAALASIMKTGAADEQHGKRA